MKAEATQHRDPITCSIAPPRWVRLFVPDPLAAVAQVSVSIEPTCRVSPDGRWAFARAVVDGARHMPDADFEAATREAFLGLLRAVGDAGLTHALRFWSHLPGIHSRVKGCPLDRYMVFNKGRFAAFAEVFSAPATQAGQIPTASAVGHDGDSLVVYLLASDVPGTPFENPRQVPAYCYSEHYGPTPPSFARATRIVGPTGQTQLLIGGTASVVGEASLHVGKAKMQCRETLRNLAALIGFAQPHATAPEHHWDDDLHWLDRLTHARVYYVSPADLPDLRHALTNAFQSCVDVEWVRADLCRSDLLVEIEGLATLEGGNLE